MTKRALPWASVLIPGLILAQTTTTVTTALTPATVFELADSDHDGRITLSEWRAAGLNESIFKQVDTGRSGSVTLAQLSASRVPLGTSTRSVTITPNSVGVPEGSPSRAQAPTPGAAGSGTSGTVMPGTTIPGTTTPGTTTPGATKPSSGAPGVVLPGSTSAAPAPGHAP